MKLQLKKSFYFARRYHREYTADEIFKKLDNFIEENGLYWQRCVGFCSDGARAMIGRYGSVVTKVKSVAPNCTFIHCSTHREALAAKRMPENF